jgi:hypothetical protein
VHDVAELVRIPGRSDPKADMPALFRNWLREKSTRKWLIVLDNADEVDFLVERNDGKASLWELLPVHDQGAVLVTSRSMSAAAKLVERSAVVSVAPMSEQQATALLETKLGRQGDNRTLAAALEYMPLAMTQAAAYIQQRGKRSSIAKYLEKLRKGDRSKGSILDEDAGDLRRDPEARNAIILTWQISFEHIRKVRQSATDLLSLMCFCDRQAIPSILLQVPSMDERSDSTTQERTEGGESSSDTESETSSRAEEEFDKDIAMLEGFAFVSTTLDSSTFEMHRLVQFATRRWLDLQGQVEHWKKVFVCNLDDAFPSGAYGTWGACQMLLPHAIAAMNLRIRDRDTLLHKASICYYAGWYMREQGLFNGSEEMCERSDKICRETLGAEDPSTLTSMASLARTYWNQGRWGEAEQLEVRVMETRTRVLGAEHPDTLLSIADLAATFKDQGRWDEAEQLAVRVLETRERVLGAEHPNTLLSIANLAATYWNQGRLNEAEQLEVQVLETRKRVLGAEHPNTLSSMANLAATYWNQGRLDEAEQLEVQVLETRKRVLGAEHPDMLSSMANLALTYRKQGRWDEAEQLGVRVLETRKRVLGAEHPDTLVSIANLAATYRYQGRWDEAEQLGVLVMETTTRMLGAEHPHTLLSIANLAATYRYQGRWDEAAHLQAQATDGYIKIYGHGHPDTRKVVANLEHYKSMQLEQRAPANTTSIAK